MKQAIIRFIRNTHAFAYLQGFYERSALGDGFGRTHDTDQAWNEAYDRGANLSDQLTGNHP